MNRHSTSVTVLGLALVLVAIPASAGDLTYDIYGKFHASLNGVNNSEETGITLSSNATHFGLRGKYGVSESLDAVWQFEGQINVAANDFTFGFNRDTYLGLAGRFGEVVVGHRDSPLKTLGRQITWFEDTIGDFRSTTMGIDSRWEETIHYSLPAWDHGFGGRFAYRLDQGDWTDSEAAAAYSLSASVTYAPSDFLFGLGLESQASGNFNPDKDEADSETTFRGVGRYDPGRFGFAAFFQGIDNYGGALGLVARTIGFEAMVMASDRWRFKGSYYATDPNSDLDDNGYSQLALGVDHLAGRATFYLQYAAMMNDTDQKAPLGNNDWGDVVLPSASGETASGLSLGMWLTF